MLCNVCNSVLHDRKGLLSDPEDPVEDSLLFGHHKTAASIQASAAANCNICHSFWKQLSPEEQRTLLNNDDPELVSICLLQRAQVLGMPNWYIFVVMLESDSKASLESVSKKEDPALSMFVLEPSSELENFPFGYPASNSTRSDECWEVASQWVDACQKQHPACNMYQNEEKWYPTRLLDLGERPMDHIRLIETREQKPDGPYVSLSHSWGSATFLQLRRDNLQEFKQGIELDTLSKTFQDAVTVARRLKVRYLWIDSLCILQDKDDLTDWLNEATLMHKVYASSFCNISATGAFSHSYGLFAERDPQLLHPTEVELRLDGMQVAEEATKYHLIDFHFWKSEIGQAPLNQRAWVVQERLLAPRVLHFAENGVFWECSEMDCSEAYPRYLPPPLAVGAVTKFKSLSPKVDGRRLRERGPGGSDPAFFAHQLWPRILEAFSSCMLTKPSDKLIAIAGIAKRMSTVIQDEYVVGMWRRFLPSELLWQVDHCRQVNHEPSLRPREYRAPTWSWASVDGCINAASPTEGGICIAVKEISIEYVTEDRTSLVKGGYVLLQGTLKQLTLKRDPGPITWTVTVNGIEIHPTAGEEWERLGPLVTLDIDQQDFDRSNESRTLYCMPARKPTGENWTFYTCLILEHHSDGAFRRVGVFLTNKKELMQLIEADNENEAHLPCEEFDPSTRIHTIRVV